MDGTEQVAWWREIPECTVNGILYRKFASLDNLKIPLNYKFPEKTQKRYNACVVYCIWDVPGYLTLAYLSLVSQFKYTDVESVDVKIFVSANMVKVAKAIFPQCVEIISIESSFNKYTITQHYSLKQYDYVVICDSDLFFYGVKEPFYQNVIKTDKVLMMKSNVDCLLEFDKRKSLSNIKNSAQYAKRMINIMDIQYLDLIKMLNTSIWYYSCFMSYPTKLLNNPEWNQYIERISELGTVCDETVFLTYFWKNGINVSDIDDSIPNTKTILNDALTDFMASPTALGLIHPLGGPACENKVLTEFYGLICY